MFPIFFFLYKWYWPSSYRKEFPSLGFFHLARFPKGKLVCQREWFLKIGKQDLRKKKTGKHKRKLKSPIIPWLPTKTHGYYFDTFQQLFPPQVNYYNWNFKVHTILSSAFVPLKILWTFSHIYKYSLRTCF